LIAAVLFRPDIVDRISHVEIAGWKFDMLEKKQQQQDKQLQDIEIILAILLTEAEQKHLLNLAGNNAANYEGSHVLRTELRRLADMRLIRRRSNREIRGITDNAKVNLADFVKLTETGDRLVARIRQIIKENEAQKNQAAAKG
jgi:molecular chaperone GrpE (heat shock protein)